MLHALKEVVKFFLPSFILNYYRSFKAYSRESARYKQWDISNREYVKSLRLGGGA